MDMVIKIVKGIVRYRFAIDTITMSF